MFGAIVGDTFGSIYEEIPNHPRRLSMSPTDDSVLTCACREWCEALDPKQVKWFEHQNNNQNQLSFESLEAQSLGMSDNTLNRYAYTQELIEKAIFVLKKWHAMFSPTPSSPALSGATVENGELLGFSKSFTRWAQEPDYTQAHKRTNGALMRQSPIAAWCVEHSMSLSVAQELARIFASPTHDHIDTYQAVEAHMALLYRTLQKEITKDNIKSFFAEQGEMFPSQKLLSVQAWREKTIKHFIWDAPQSYQIVCSVLNEANSFEEAFDNCVLVGGDVDTYAAIMGPIAETLWGIPEDMKKKVRDILFTFPEILKYYRE